MIVTEKDLENGAILTKESGCKCVIYRRNPRCPHNPLPGDDGMLIFGKDAREIKKYLKGVNPAHWHSAYFETKSGHRSSMDF